MGAEYELKFRINPDTLHAVFTTFPARWQNIYMQTTYYDTPDGQLSARRWTLRSRLENDVSVCTLKTPGENGVRGEWETECGSIEAAIPELCKLSGTKELESLCAEGLVTVCGARFTRKAGLFILRDCTVEIALDEGVLLGGGKEVPLCELEVELKEGSREAADAFAAQLADIYGLQTETKSKFARALALCKEGYYGMPGQIV